MADLYSTPIGVHARKVLTTSDNSGPELTWLVVDNNDGNFESGSSYDAELTTANSTNAQVIRAIAQRCEIYEIVRPSSSILSIQVRKNSVPYAAGEAANDGNTNSILTAELRSAMGGNTGYTVWNGAFQDDDINWD